MTEFSASSKWKHGYKYIINNITFYIVDEKSLCLFLCVPCELTFKVGTSRVCLYVPAKQTSAFGCISMHVCVKTGDCKESINLLFMLYRQLTPFLQARLGATNPCHGLALGFQPPTHSLTLTLSHKHTSSHLFLMIL